MVELVVLICGFCIVVLIVVVLMINKYFIKDECPNCGDINIDKEILEFVDHEEVVHVLLRCRKCGEKFDVWI
jgi:predicted RNA-binding Zn-ribbon protein involved in translation (DUF1610 family)